MKTIKTIQAISLAILFSVSGCAKACLTAETESNDTEPSADLGLCSDTTVAGDLSRNDVDWFEFQLDSDGTINISLDHHSRDDFDWDLYKSSGSAVASGASSSVPESGSYAGTAGTYFLKLSRYSGRGWYDLTVSFNQDNNGGGGNGDDCGYGARPSSPSNLDSWLTGSGVDACSNLQSGDGAALLMGGGSDVDASFSNRVRPHIGNGMDTVILRTSGSDGYNDYLLDLMQADSVETLLVDTRNLANSAYVDWVVRSAEFVFIAGGDQSDYLNQWQGTALQSALQHVFDKGGVIGGTSAGMALLASSIYDPDGIAGAVSDEVVTDFCHQTINFSSGFVSLPMLPNSLTDTHFAERDRMGRSTVFLAHHSANHYSISADENAAIFVTADGQGIVDGSGAVYIIKEQGATQRTRLQCGQSVIYEDVLRVKLSSNDTYNFNNHQHSGATLTFGIDGRNNNFYSPTNPY